ncbi:pirin [Streptomyces sp. NPDC055721]|uniref:pirin n=1 Tax=Streptomyces sp. NPDC127132 TaxID=3345374 RepID=UPI0036271240
MWWNFVGRTDEEIREAREEWMTSDHFGEVKGYDGDRLDAPEVPAAGPQGLGRTSRCW